MKMNPALIMNLFVLILTACRPVIPTSTPTPLPTQTLIPTMTLTPVPTQTPTRTAIPPTPTVEVPGILSNYLEGVKIINFGTFDSLISTPRQWFFYNKSVELRDGQVYFKGQDEDAMYFSKYREGYGVMFDFMVDPDQSPADFRFVAGFDGGGWWTSNYRRFAIELTPLPRDANAWAKHWPGQFNNHNFNPVPGVWYQAALAIGEQVDLFYLLRERNNLENVRYERISMGEKWSGVDWKFSIGGPQGTLVVDNFMSYSFEKLK